MKNSPKDSIYVKALLWGYKKQHTGFTKAEMKVALNISETEWSWVDWVFTNALNGDAPLFWYGSFNKNKNGDTDHTRYYITVVGMSAAVDYLELKEAQRGGRNAMTIAIISILVSIVVGVIQIYIEIKASRNQKDFNEISAKNEVIDSVKTKTDPMKG